MAVFTLNIPDFKWTGLYYPQIKQALVLWRRANMPELSDEDPNEPTMQLLDGFAVAHHYAGVLLDHVALETLWPTTRLRETAKAHMALIGQRVLEAVPAVVDLVAKLASPLTAATTLPDAAQFATERVGTVQPITYENIGEIALSRTDQFNYAYAYDSAVFVDRTSEVNTPTGFTLWAGSPAAEDMLYLGLDEAVTTGLKVVMSALGDIWDVDNHVWEYYDGGTDDSNPSLVTDGGATIEFDLTNLLGANNRAGSEVVVKHLASGASETATSVFSGGANKVTTGVLGQSLVSTTLTDYTVGVKWKEVPGLAEAFSGTIVEVTYSMPDLVSISRHWKKTTVNSREAYWVRLRLPQSATVSPVISGGVDPTTKDQYLLFQATQGETVEDDPAGTFAGTGGEVFRTTQGDVIEGSLTAYVDEGGGYTEYAAVDDFLSSESSSRDFILEFDSDSYGVGTFGDGTNGTKPSASQTVKFVYRVGATEDGNVGKNEVIVNKTSVAYIATVTNPRPATGWEAPQGSTDESLAALKISGPATLRVRDRAVTIDDLEELSRGWKAADGSKPVKRVKGVVDGFGEKTIKLLVVGPGGAQLDEDALAALDVAANGDTVAGTSGWLVDALESTAVNYTRRVINVTVTIVGGTKATAEAAIAAYLLPDNLKANGDWEHDFGDTVYGAKIGNAIFADDDVEDVGSISNVVLLDDELPYPGVITVTVT